MSKININMEDLSKTTNNYDLRLIKKETLGHNLTKESLEAFVEEIPKNHNQWQHMIILTVLIYGMVFFFHLAEGILQSWGIVYYVVKALVAFFIAVTFATAIIHILNYQRTLKHINRGEIALIRTNNIMNRFLVIVLSASILVLSWSWLSFEGRGTDLLFVFALIMIVYISIHARYKTTYIQTHLGFLLHHIQNSIIEKKQ